MEFIEQIQIIKCADHVDPEGKKLAHSNKSPPG